MKYKTCIPDRLPLRSLNWDAFVPLIGKAHAVLARYNEMLKQVKNPEQVFSTLTLQEVLSSVHSQQVTTTMKELLIACAFEPVSDREDLLTIINYHVALSTAVKQVKKSSISLTLLRKIHGIIKQDATLPKKDIGKFRDRQNWIGKKGCSIDKAYYYPPAVNILSKSMLELKKYIAYQEKDPLVQLAVFFAQLLIIHPFMDGNGRVARICIPLFLYKKKLLSTPMFYLSSYFKKHRLEYFERLFLINSTNDWNQWISFFLSSMIEEGEKLLSKGEKILRLYQQMQQETFDLESSQDIINALFSSPIANINQWEGKDSSLNVIKRLEEKKLISIDKKKSMVSVKKLLTID
ncbi:MAG: Fic family protein [Chlamydiales bacterium]|nr:Fic family protein [Chlamydiales bacterium]